MLQREQRVLAILKDKQGYLRKSKGSKQQILLSEDSFNILQVAGEFGEGICLVSIFPCISIDGGCNVNEICNDTYATVLKTKIVLRGSKL